MCQSRAAFLAALRLIPPHTTTQARELLGDLMEHLVILMQQTRSKARLVVLHLPAIRLQPGSHRLNQILPDFTFSQRMNSQ